jgi:hypothetical protein
MNTLAPKQLLAIGASLFLTVAALAKGPPRNPYANELLGFKFYVKYLAPLRPYVSDRALVVHVLGPDQGLHLSGWRIWPLFVGDGNKVNGHLWAQDASGRLASVRIIPKRRVSMLAVKFPAAFTHSTGGVSEINVPCDVYRDNFGLEYWIYAEDTPTGKRGDLMYIEYGPDERIERQVVGPS